MYNLYKQAKGNLKDQALSKEKKQPIFIIIDEVNFLIHENNKVTLNDELIYTFQSIVGGIKDRDCEDIFTILVTNEDPEMYYDTFTRKGRFVIYDFKLPENKQRIDIMKNIIENMTKKDKIKFYGEINLDLEYFSSSMKNFSQADILSLFANSVIDKIPEKDNNNAELEITKEDILEQIKKIKKERKKDEPPYGMYV